VLNGRYFILGMKLVDATQKVEFENYKTVTQILYERKTFHARSMLRITVFAMLNVFKTNRFR
jgi:hypothetical protein